MAKGNLRYWGTLVACCGMAASSIGVFTNATGIFYTPVAAALGVGVGSFALHATLTLLGVGFFSPMVAWLMRKIPLQALLLVGLLMACMATAAMAFTRNIWVFYALGALKGVGMACFSLMPITTIIGNWFYQSHGLAVGIALSFSGLSGAVFSPLFSWMIQVTSWQEAYLWMAAFGFALALPGVLTLRLSPSEVSLPAFGGQVEKRTVALPPMPKVTRQGLCAVVLMALFALLHNAVTSIAQHFPGLSQSLGMGAAVGAVMVSCGMVGNIMSKVIIGVLSDRLGPFRACASMIVVNGLSLGVLLFFGNNPTVAMCAAFFYGSVYAVAAVGMPLLTRSLFGVERYAWAYSIITIFTGVGSALALTLIGFAFDIFGSYLVPIALAIAMDGFNLVLLFVLFRMKKQKKG